MLRKHGIRPILNYAAEDDVSGSPAHIQCADIVAEQVCDANMLPFLKSIADCGSREGKGFVAAKVFQSNLSMQKCYLPYPQQLKMAESASGEEVDAEIIC